MSPMSLSLFASSVLFLLLTPGPTNTLLALASCERGLWKSLHLAGVELVAYLCAVVPLVFLVYPWIEQSTGFGIALRLLAAAWLLYLSIKMLKSRDIDANITRARHVFFTTLLNPKALIFGLVLVPSATSDVHTALLVFSCVVVMASLIWLSLGTLVLRSSKYPVVAFRSLAALVLAFFSVLLVVASSGAVLAFNFRDAIAGHTV